MDVGGRESKDQKLRHETPIRRAPTDKPPFTLGQLKKAIPPHCFHRSVLKSFSYLVYDLTISSILLYFALYQIPALPSPLNLLAWPVYWILQGCFLMAVWVIAHECGHHAFSNYSILDDIVGFILHSALLVPYFSWKYSHGRHHSNTASLDNDENYVPIPKSSLSSYSKYQNTPLGRFLTIFVTLTMGFPLYLAFNVSSRAYPRFANHFDPNSPIYTDNQRAQIIISDIGLLSVFYALYRLTVAYSLGWVIRIYGIPLLIVNGWLIMITYLHHTHSALPHYDSTEWDWLRGALSTVDRNYGVIDKVLHHITDTHVLHHLFSKIPHYNAKEASEAIKPILGEYYRIDTTPVYKALWRENKECVYVEAEKGDEKPKGIFWYENKI